MISLLQNTKCLNLSFFNLDLCDVEVIETATNLVWQISTIVHISESIKSAVEDAILVPVKAEANVTGTNVYIVTEVRLIMTIFWERRVYHVCVLLFCNKFRKDSQPSW